MLVWVEADRAWEGAVPEVLAPEAVAVVDAIVHVVAGETEVCLIGLHKDLFES